MGRCEVSVEYADGSRGSFCLVPDSDGMCQLVVLPGVRSVSWQRFVEDSGSSQRNYAGPAEYLGVSVTIREL